jgi:Bacteriophage tail sheath protein
VPEYLAPGVYVEETSFRAKSIEGVSTSTTGFVGPTRKGPVGDTPEILTSFGDFQRIYGGLDDLARGTNYVAHGVRNYFDNGGSRLYVSRAFLPAIGDPRLGRAASAPVVSGDDTHQALFVARFPGAAGNGRLTLREVAAPATRRSMDAAKEGTTLRVGGASPALPARLQGGTPPFSVTNDGRLLLTVGGADSEIVFHGEPAEALASDALPNDVTLDATNNTLRIVVDGREQAITLPVATTPRAEILSAINRAMRNGYARLTDANDPAPVNRLVIGSDRRGRGASVAVTANAALGFSALATALGTANPNNTVNDLDAVTADEINALLVAAGIQARAGFSSSAARLVLTSVATGSGASLSVRGGPSSVHDALGLVVGAQSTGTAGSSVSYYVKRGTNWLDEMNAQLNVSGLQMTEAPAGGADFVTVTILAEDADGNAKTYENLGFDGNHPRWVGHVLAATPGHRTDALENLYALEIGANVTAFDLRTGLFPTGEESVITLRDGNDGAEPTQAAYEAALEFLDRLEDISIIAAPGHSAAALTSDFQGIQGALISHAERRRAYRIAVLDTPPAQAVSEARAVRSCIDSTYAALYYPWVIVSNPLARPGDDSIPREIPLPPSGFVCGIYARTDVDRGVFKAPANEIVRGALRFESDINFAQQEVLNPIGVNCLRYLSGRGFRLWGARTASSDPEWKYVNVRRYFNFLEASIDRSTQWAVFEPNGERLWANIRETVESFLYGEWRSGALLGASPKEAFFVRCDRSTMTQNDLDNGRLICLIGVAVVKPAEFVIFRIGQKTADARN